MEQNQKTHFDPNKNKIFFGNTDKLNDWIVEGMNQALIIDKIKLMLKNYLELDNVSFLFGSGTSIHLGAVAIRNFPYDVEKYIVEKNKETEYNGIYDEFETTVKALQNNFLEYGRKNLDEGSEDSFENEKGWKFYIEDEFVRDNIDGEIVIEYEKILNYLIAKDFVLEEDQSKVRIDKIPELITAIKEGLFNVCNLEKRSVSKTIIDRKKQVNSQKKKPKENYLNLKANIFFMKNS